MLRYGFGQPRTQRGAKLLVRFGIPPGRPALVQSMARERSMIPDHSCACAVMGVTMNRSATSQEMRGITASLYITRAPWGGAACGEIVIGRAPRIKRARRSREVATRNA